MVKLLLISVTYEIPQNKVSDSITHVTLNTINDVDFFCSLETHAKFPFVLRDCLTLPNARHGQGVMFSN
jgi:hypothetical protein